MDTRFFNRTEIGLGEEVRKQSKKAINLANISYNGKSQAEDVLISSFLPSTIRQGPEQALYVRQRGRIF